MNPIDYYFINYIDSSSAPEPLDECIQLFDRGWLYVGQAPLYEGCDFTQPNTFRSLNEALLALDMIKLALTSKSKI